MSSPATFQATQDAHWSQADADHFNWTTRDPMFAPVEDELLLPRLAALPFPCLEVGSGDGTNLARLARFGAPYGIDRYPDKARFAAHAVPTARLAAADATALPYRDGVFRSILIRDLLHHLPEPRRATAEAARVLAPGGTLLVIEPNGRNPLVAIQARLVAAEAVLKDFGVPHVQRALAGLPLREPTLEMTVGFPLRRLVLHHRFGLPLLGRLRAGRDALRACERLMERLLPRDRWSYAVFRTTRL